MVREDYTIIDCFFHSGFSAWSFEIFSCLTYCDMLQKISGVTEWLMSYIFVLHSGISRFENHPWNDEMLNQPKPLRARVYYPKLCIVFETCPCGFVLNNNNSREGWRKFTTIIYFLLLSITTLHTAYFKRECVNVNALSVVF